MIRLKQSGLGHVWISTTSVAAVEELLNDEYTVYLHSGESFCVLLEKEQFAKFMFETGIAVDVNKPENWLIPTEGKEDE